MVESAPYTILDVAAGVGMLSAGLKLGLELLGARGLVVGGVERDTSAAASFLAWMEHSQGGCPPVWDDARTFVGRRDRRLESVDVVCAGYPCQPFSAAGRRLGSKDPRHLWPAVRRIVARVQPQLVFFENVDGHVTMGLGKVLRDCERLGYRVTPGVYSAEEVGAPHLRKRVFILGYRTSSEQRDGAVPGLDGQGLPHRGSSCDLGNADGSRTNAYTEAGTSRGAIGESSRSVGDAQHEPARHGVDRVAHGTQSGSRGSERTGRGSDELADAECKPGSAEQQHDEGERENQGPEYQSVHGRSGEELADDDLARLESWRPASGVSCGDRSVDRSGGIVPIFPPHRTDYRRWAELVALGLDPTLMPAIESGLSVVADGLAAPADILRCGGNGVVPLTAAWAFINLAACLFVEESQLGSLGGARRGSD